MSERFSLHAARVPHTCQCCGGAIPTGGEYWRVKGGHGARIVCIYCHVLYGLPTDGWTDAPDGVNDIAALVPSSR